MEISPYLQAIQQVPGTTPGEKHKSLDSVARQIIAECSNASGQIQVQLLEPLVPIVNFKVARISKNPEGIVAALKSDDQHVFERALKVKWFFNGSIKNYTNAAYFKDNIFSFVSLNHRLRIIRTLATNLASKEPKIAEDFYNMVSQVYSETQARKLLKACSEQFIWDTIINNHIVLGVDEVKYLFIKHQELIIKYLKLALDNQHKNGRNMLEISIHEYTDFLPKLIKKYSKLFVSIINKLGKIYDLILHNRNQDNLLKTEADAIIKKPKLFLHLLQLKRVTEKLTREQFKTMFQNLFPKDRDDFNFEPMFNYLAHFPVEDQIPLLLESFEEAYQISILECIILVTPGMMRLLPSEERIRQARIKLEVDKDWYTENLGMEMQCSWRCYLPTQESIPLIKAQINKSEDGSERLALLMQMIYTCEVNDNDIDALLGVIKYIFSRFKNDQDWILSELLNCLNDSFKIETLPEEHWKELDTLMKYLCAKHMCFTGITNIRKIINRRIIYDLNNNLPITGKLEELLQFNLKVESQYFVAIRDYPQYEKICLDEFTELIPKIMLKYYKSNSPEWKITVVEFAKVIHGANMRNKEAKNGIEKMWIKNYPWLLKSVQEYVEEHIDGKNNYQTLSFFQTLVQHDPKLFGHLKPQVKQPDLDLVKGINVLRKNPTEILTSWEEYLETCKTVVNRCHIKQKRAKRFLISSRWYQDIPIKFVEKCVKDLPEETKWQSVIVYLLEGSALEKLLEIFVPKSDLGMSVDAQMASSQRAFSFYSQILCHVNPPVSLNFLLKFCEVDHIHVLSSNLINITKNVALDKVIPFSYELINRPQVSVKKQGIRILCANTSREQWIDTIKTLMKKETHRSIRLLIAQMVFNAFTEKPCSETWQMVGECLSGLKKDDGHILDHVIKVGSVPDEYVSNYVKNMLQIYRKFRQDKIVFDDNMDEWVHTRDLLEELKPEVAELFSEEFHQELLQEFLVAPSLPINVLSVMNNYLINCYLLTGGDQLDTRLVYFRNIFTEICGKWDSQDPEGDNLYPAQFFANGLIQIVIFGLPFSETKKKIIQTTLDAFPSVLQPQQAPEFYCTFSMAVLYQDKIMPQEFTDKVRQLLPTLIDIFSPELVIIIANFLHRLIRYFWKENVVLLVVEHLLSFSYQHADNLAAALLMLENHDPEDEQFWRINRKLRKLKHPLAVSISYMAMNSFSTKKNFLYTKIT